jgi:2-polyprenyl-3-methyl-5-hydroxy-6-metoxy-1,4-benzoquinol methylase
MIGRKYKPMNLELVSRLRCPKSGQSLSVEAGAERSSAGKELMDGWLVSDDGKHRYPIRNGIPRFVPESNYADNFGMQWNHFAKTQLDSHSGHPISADRFWQATQWRPDEIRGKWVLDVGCGSGRFAEIALSAGANVVALDYSSAVDACYANLKQHANLHVVQGDIYALPFAHQSFPFVYSLGVLQHTPDVAGAFLALPPLLEDGGKLCVDYYEKTYKSAFLPKYWLRPITKRLPQRKLFSALETLVPAMLPVSRVLGRIPGIGKAAMRIVPVVNYEGMYPLSEQQLREWALLDTFDMFAPAYDQPQSAAAVRRLLEQAGLKEIEMTTVGHLVGRGVR